MRKYFENVFLKKTLKTNLKNYKITITMKQGLCTTFNSETFIKTCFKFYVLKVRDIKDQETNNNN